MIKKSKRKKRKDTYAKTQYKKQKNSEKFSVDKKPVRDSRNQDREAEIEQLIK